MKKKLLIVSDQRRADSIVEIMKLKLVTSNDKTLCDFTPVQDPGRDVCLDVYDNDICILVLELSSGDEYLKWFNYAQKCFAEVYLFMDIQFLSDQLPLTRLWPDANEDAVLAWNHQVLGQAKRRRVSEWIPGLEELHPLDDTPLPDPCVACGEKVANVKLDVCGHTPMCNKCSLDYFTRIVEEGVLSCPICRAGPVKKITKC